MQRGKPRKLGLYREARGDDLRGCRELAQIGHVREVQYRPRADEGAAPDMAPDQAVLLEPVERLAQLAARHAEGGAEAPFGGMRSLCANPRSAM